jgi:hypothetical protein
MFICGCLVVVAPLTELEKRERLCLPEPAVVGSWHLAGLFEPQYSQASSVVVLIA